MNFKRMFFSTTGALATVILISAVVQATTVSLNATEDTYVRGPANSVDKNYGLSGQLIVGSVGTTDGHALFRFDLSGIPATDTINSVTLTTTADGNDGSSQTSLTLDVFELAAANADWAVGTASGAVAGSGATWLLKDADTPMLLFQEDWAGGANGAGVAGTDYINTNLGSYTDDPQAITAGTSMAFTSTAAFKTSVANNVGGFLNLIVFKDDTARNFFRIASNENGSGRAGPVLTIDHSAIPEPTSLVLFGLASLGMLGIRSRR